MPRNYRHRLLPSGPPLKDIKVLLKSTEGDGPTNIRDRAAILLLIIYGLRSREVVRLKLEDFDWEQRTFTLRHLKRGPIQKFPIIPTLGQALARYLKEVRPQHTPYREVFLSRLAPFTPLAGANTFIHSRWRKLHIDIKGHGPHSLRHACATRMINQDVPLKTIADQLGHRNIESTRVYAKVDLIRLREVANSNMGGLLS
jgi:integrase